MGRWIFILCLGVAFVGAGTIIGTAFEQANTPITSEVALGHRVWVTNNCEQCHSLYGQGGNYAPELTHIISQRGTDYIADFLVNPPAYHPNERMMPRLNISQIERNAVIAYLQFAQDQTVASAVPVVNVVGSGGQIEFVENTNPNVILDPIADGRRVFSTRCASCHSLERDVVIVGPSFYDIGNLAWYRVIGQSAEQYIRNSIVYPGDYIVEGYADVMQKNFGEVLSVDDIEHVVAYLLTLREDGETP
jgi:cytochrome c2